MMAIVVPLHEELERGAKTSKEQGFQVCVCRCLCLWCVCMYTAMCLSACVCVWSVCVLCRYFGVHDCASVRACVRARLHVIVPRVFHLQLTLHPGCCLSLARWCSAPVDACTEQKAYGDDLSQAWACIHKYRKLMAVSCRTVSKYVHMMHPVVCTAVPAPSRKCYC